MLQGHGKDTRQGRKSAPIDTQLSLGERMEIRIQRAVRIQPCQTGSGHPVHRPERAADNDLSVRLNGNGIDRIVLTHARVERLVNRAIWMQSHDV